MIFDKPSVITTVKNDAASIEKTFRLQKNIFPKIFKIPTAATYRNRWEARRVQMIRQGGWESGAARREWGKKQKEK